MFVTSLWICFSEKEESEEEDSEEEESEEEEEEETKVSKVKQEEKIKVSFFNSFKNKLSKIL